MNIQISKFIVYSLLLTVYLNCSTNKKVKSYHAIDFSIQKAWSLDTCGVGFKGIFIDYLLEYPILEMDTSIALKWLGTPIHKRFYKNNSTTYIYYYSGYPSNETCMYSDLFCIEFDDKGIFTKNFIFFILEDEKATIFWHSNKLPSKSYEKKDSDEFLLFFYK